MKIIYTLTSDNEGYENEITYDVFIQPKEVVIPIQILSTERVGADEYIGFSPETTDAIKLQFPNMRDAEVMALGSAVSTFCAEVNIKDSAFSQGKRSKKLSTKEYLEKNNLTVGTAITFTNNDLEFMDKEGIKDLHINKEKPSYEVLTRTEVMERLIELYRLSAKGLLNIKVTEARHYDAVKI